ncbi:MAG: helix-turn-helix protein [Gammaproteobacteria bacterium]|nr:helix-turn-helix protein [Gammaproteobacteria bacterium]
MTVASFSTENVRPRDRIEAWGGQVWSAIGRLHTTIEAGRDFDAAVQFGDIGTIKLCNITVGPHRIERTPELIRRDDRGLLKVVFQTRGRTFLEQGGRQLVLTPGAWSIYDTSRPYRIFNSEPIELLAMLVPRDELIDKSLDVSGCTLQRLSSEGGLGRVIRKFTRSLLEDLPALSPDLAPDLTATALELIRLAVLEHSRSSCALSAGELLKERIKTYVRRHLRDPRFSIEMMAAAMKCSKRYLHKAFSGEEQQTLSHYIWSSRLECCQADLLNPKYAGKSITEIAFSWGFNNAAHFSRCFKTRFGVTPSDYRLSNGRSLAHRPAAAQPPGPQSLGRDSPCLPPGQPVPVL